MQGWGRTLRRAGVELREGRASALSEVLCLVGPILPFRDLFKHGVVGGFWLVGVVEQEGGAAGAVGVRSNPGIFVDESPGLNRSATPALQASAHDAAIDFGLAKKILVRSNAIGIYR